MFEGSCGDLTIWNMERAACTLPLGIKRSPAFCDGTCHWQDAAGEDSRQLKFKPGFEGCAPLVIWPQHDTLTNLPKAHHTHEERAHRLRNDPRAHSWVRPDTDRLDGTFVSNRNPLIQDRRYG